MSVSLKEKKDIQNAVRRQSGSTAVRVKSVYRAPKGLTEAVVHDISEHKNEPAWMRDVRLRAYATFCAKKMPAWGPDLSALDFNAMTYYIRPQDRVTRSWAEVPSKIKETFDKLGIPQAERKFLAGAGAQWESEVVYHSLKESLRKQGVIFESMDEGLRKYPDLVRHYFGTIVPPTDNKFAALNTAVWSGGSFVYVPKGVHVTLPLQAYFRINEKNMGQFERTLIIAEEGSSVHYVEGCFLKGARVQTRIGEKPIELIQKGDEVMTHKGRYRKVYQTMKRLYSGKIYTMNYFGDSFHGLNITEEHPLLVVKREHFRDRNKTFEPEWMPASAVKMKDYLAIPIPKATLSTSNVIRTEILHGRGRHAPKCVDVSFPVEKDFFRLLGYFYAEGHIDNEHYITFSFNSNEKEYIKDVDSLCKKYFGKDVIHNRVRQNGQTLVVCSTRHARAWSKLFGSRIGNKHIPECIYNAPLECLEALVNGMWRGDGSYDAKKNMFRYNSVSYELTFGFRDALLRLGMPASVNYQIRKEPRMPMYTIVVPSPYNKHFGNIVGRSVKNGTKRGSPFHIDEKYLYVPVRSIKTRQTRVDVYNFSVEDDESYVCEGVISHNCTAPTYSSDSLHSAVVEIFVKKNARVQYTTIQNWSGNVYNLVTKRAVVYEGGEMFWLDCNIGSKVTMKYPSIILREPHAKGEILSFAYAGRDQHQDAGGKVIHLAPHTSSTIRSRSISNHGGRSSYRGLVKVVPGARDVTVNVSCDALLLDSASRSDTYPTMDIAENEVSVAHEARVSRISEDALFYLMARGLSEQDATSLLVNGFANAIVKKLPMEYAIELHRLLALEAKGGIG